MATHPAAVCLAKGEPFQIQARPTRKPGPGELLIEVKSVAINPADGIMRDTGLMIATYPTVTGFDIAGLVVEVGDNVPTSTSGTEPGFQPGKTRVAAYAAFLWNPGDPAYGGFQERCLVPWQHAVPLPDESISWTQAATLPVAVQVPLNAWDIMGIPRLGESAPQQGHGKSEALLIWGASSSVGTMGVQSARLLREDRRSSFAAVYATAGASNHKYVASLGADRVFDYKDPQVVDHILSAAREDGLVVRHCFLAIGSLTLCQAVLKAFVRDGEGEKQKAKIASAPPVPPDAKDVDGMETLFVLPSMDDAGKRLAQFRYWMGTWLREQLVNGTIRPSPEPTVVGKGLNAVNAGLNAMLQGVSCSKLVVEVAE